MSAVQLFERSFLFGRHIVTVSLPRMEAGRVANGCWVVTPPFNRVLTQDEIVALRALVQRGVDALVAEQFGDEVPHGWVAQPRGLLAGGGDYDAA